MAAKTDRGFVPIKVKGESEEIRLFPVTRSVLGIRWSCGDFLSLSAAKLLGAIGAAEVAQSHKIKGVSISLDDHKAFVRVEAHTHPSGGYQQHFSNYGGNNICVQVKGRKLVVIYDCDTYEMPLADLKKGVNDAMKIRPLGLTLGLYTYD